MSYYNADLAYVHDEGHATLAQHASKMIAQTIYKKTGKKGLVVDLGCGSGIVAKELLTFGYQVLGIDQSKEFIEIAKQKAPQAKFVIGSFFHIEIPKCSAVISTGECLNYLFDEQNNLNMLSDLFTKIFQALEKGGVFIFDMIESGISGDQKKIIDDLNWTLFVHIYENPETQILVRDITIFRKVGDLYRKSKESHRVQLYPRDEIAHLLEKIGFHISPIDGYGPMKFREHHYGFLCIK